MSEKLNHQLDFVDPGDEILRKAAQEVIPSEIDSPDIQTFIDAMFKTARGEQGDAEKRTMVGLAAPQVGVPKRIILVGVNSVGLGEQPEFRAYINPEILDMSEETEEGREGCYSTNRVCGIVERPQRIKIKAYNRDGEVIIEEFEGFPARVFQHEVDHLHGIRFPDRITDDDDLHWVEEEDFGRYRHKWTNWNHLCPRKRWEAIKFGSIEATQ